MAYSSEIFKDAQLVSIECNMPGNRRKLDDDEYETEADKEFTDAAKKLFVSSELQKIPALYSSLKRALKDVAIPAKMFRRGCYMIKNDLVPEVQEMIMEYRVKLADALDGFLEVYDERLAEAKVKTKGLFKADQYPSKERFRRRVRIHASYLVIGVPDSLKAIDPKLYAEQTEQLDQEWKKAGEEVRLALRQSMLGLVAHLRDRLTDDEDGEKKQIKQSGFDKLEKFLKYFNDRDITNDAEMKVIVKKARELLANTDIEKLRDDATFRAGIKDSFAEVADKLDAMVKSQASRVIKFDD